MECQLEKDIAGADGKTFIFFFLVGVAVIGLSSPALALNLYFFVTLVFWCLDALAPYL